MYVNDRQESTGTGSTPRGGWKRSAALVATAALALGAAGCGSDDDDTSTTDPAPADTTGDTNATDDTVADTLANEFTDDTLADDFTDDTTADESADDETATSVDATAADVFTDTLAGEGVDLFLTLLPLVGLDEITEADEITLFVPSDEAWQSIEADEVASIVEDPLLVRDVLESHVVEGAFESGDLEDGMTISPVSGEELTVSIDGDTVMVGVATVISADIGFDGGVIHVIDNVLQLPSA